jgi:hypothetical protein
LGIYSEAGFVFNKIEELNKKGELKLSDQEKRICRNSIIIGKL